MRILLIGLALLPWIANAAEEPWHVFYDTDAGFTIQPSYAWIGDGTRSEHTPEGLRIVDASVEGGSGRLYCCDWQVNPDEGAVVEARLKLIDSSGPWGSCVNVADSVNEEDISFLPDRVRLSYAGLEAPFPTTEAFHTYRIEFKAPDIRVWADGALIIDGAGKFVQPVIAANRDRLAFGASASTTTSETLWQSVRFTGGGVPDAFPTSIDVPGLSVERGETVPIQTDASYTNMFRFAGGRLQVGSRQSTDGGKTWVQGAGPWVGSCQLPDGEVIGLDYRTHADDEKGWFKSALTRFDAAGKALPTLNARLHVPQFVPMVDDDGSVRDGPWCDHSIVLLRDGSLLSANSGCFAEDTTAVSSYPEGFGAHKYRGFVTRSTDRGLTWEYLSTVTSDPDLGSEGCNEMDLIRAPNGDLLCMFRTGGSRTNPSPMYQCRSLDEGKSWGPPQRVADWGVWPNMCVTDDDVLVCTYGRPGNWLIFSLDSGQTWVGDLCFQMGPTTSYNSVEQVSPARILVTYDQSSCDRGGNMTSGTVGTFFTVKRR